MSNLPELCQSTCITHGKCSCALSKLVKPYAPTAVPISMEQQPMANSMANLQALAVPELQMKLSNCFNSRVPERASIGAAGYDCFVAEDTLLGEPSEVTLVPLGFHVAIPQGYVGLLIPRSSLFKRLGLKLANTVGVIDSDYRGEVMAAITRQDAEAVNTLSSGNRICQLVVVPCITPPIMVVSELPPTVRGEGGFGSTGA